MAKVLVLYYSTYGHIETMAEAVAAADLFLDPGSIVVNQGRERAHLAPVTGVFAAQEIKPQARVLAGDRGIRCVTLDYDGMKGVESGAPRLF